MHLSAALYKICMINAHKYKFANFLIFILNIALLTYLQGSYLETIHPIDAVRNLKKRPEIGQRVRLSEGDIAQTKLLYKCYSE